MLSLFYQKLHLSRGSALRATAKLSQRYPHIPRCWVLGVSIVKRFGCTTPPLACELEARSPHARGVSQRYFHDTTENGCAILSRHCIAWYGGDILSWAAKCISDRNLLWDVPHSSSTACCELLGRMRNPSGNPVLAENLGKIASKNLYRIKTRRIRPIPKILKAEISLSRFWSKSLLEIVDFLWIFPAYFSKENGPKKSTKKSTAETKNTKIHK